METALFYRACDELGLLVIQDMPSPRPLQNKDGQTILPDETQQKEFARQLDLLVNQHKSYPSVVTWVCIPLPIGQLGIADVETGDL